MQLEKTILRNLLKNEDYTRKVLPFIRDEYFAVEGQQFAADMGFSRPSEDVEEIEMEDILTRWAVFLHYGLLKEIEQSSKWFTQFMTKTGKIDSDENEFRSLLTVYGVAMLNKIMDSEKLAFVIPFGDNEDE